jgi:hypothetical protein
VSLTLSPGMSRDNSDPRVRVTFVALIIACGVITVLTAAAFWLSYAHLAGIAGEHGLGGHAANVQARKWAWPATLDLFIIAGEVLMFVDALRGRTGRKAAWPIGLTVAGSVGSIGLNIAGVGSGAGLLDYIVAGVPPTAALLAFGALMRQVHDFIVSLSPEPAVPGDTGQTDVPVPTVPVVSPPPRQDVPVESRPVEPVPAALSPAPEPTVPAVVSPARPVVQARVNETESDGDTSRDKGQARVDVPEDKLGNLSAIVRFLMETGHSKDEIRAIVPTLPGQGDVKPDSLKKAVQRAEKALAADN